MPGDTSSPLGKIVLLTFLGTEQEFTGGHNNGN